MPRNLPLPARGRGLRLRVNDFESLPHQDREAIPYCLPAGRELPTPTLVSA